MTRQNKLEAMNHIADHEVQTPARSFVARGHTKSCEILSTTCCITYKNCILKRLAIGEWPWFKGYWKRCWFLSCHAVL